MEKAKAKFEQFFIWLLYINPVFDIIGGLFIKIYEDTSGTKFDTLKIPLTPSLIMRMVILLAFAAYILILKNKKELLSFAAIGAAWALSVAGEILFAEKFSLFTDVQYIAKFVFNIAVIVVYMNVFKGPSLDKEKLMRLLNRVVIWTLLLLAGTIVICYYFRYGDFTYGDRFGFFGFRGIFYSGNDITAVFMLLLPSAIGILMYLPKETSLKTRLLVEFACAAALISLLIISTKTSFIAVAASAVLLVVFGVAAALKKGGFELKRVLAVVVIAALLFGSFLLTAELAGHSSLIDDLNNSIGHSGQIKDDNGDPVLSGRGEKLMNALKEYKKGGVYSWLFGIGRGTQEQIIEMDVFEVLCYYGLFGLVAMLWIYVKYGVGFLRAFFKKINMMGICLVISIGMCAGYMALAGHVLFSVTSGFYFSLMLVYGRVFYADKTETLSSL